MTKLNTPKLTYYTSLQTNGKLCMFEDHNFSEEKFQMPDV